MRILIIGNGFDKAHGLATNYKEYIDMMDIFLNYYGWNGPCYAITNEYKKYTDFCKRIGSDGILNNLNKAIKESCWIKIFNKMKDHVGDKWFDLEEIIRIIVENANNCRESDHNGRISSSSKKQLSDFYDASPFLNKCENYVDLFREMNNDLDDVKKSLSIYVGQFISSFSPNKLRLFDELIGANKVLSFNYTRTYENTYNKLSQGNLCYIHGVAQPHDETVDANIVLGFDKSYNDEDKSYSDLIPFEKYYQRIVNHCDNSYYSWFDSIKYDKKEVELFIFGHSLAPSDGDVLMKFITNEYIKTTVFYLNEKDRAEKIKNLAIILGQSELVKLAGGLKPRIRFIQYDSNNDATFVLEE